jgi:hypothetical protein
MKDRLISISYSDSTPTTQYFHDQTSFNGLTITYGGDERTGMSDGSGQTAWSFDPAGHIIAERRTIGTVTESTSYAYNVDGSAASITYPSGRVVFYSYNNAQQPVSVVDGTNGTNYVTGATYAPHGQLASAVHGQVSGGFAGITETYTYNNRLQIATHRASSSAGTALDHTYSYGAANNGNISSITNNLNTGRSQSFTYDNMNRLASAQSQATTGADCWGDSYGYDRYGNLLTMTVTKCTAQNLSVSVDGSNHIIGMNYDAAGNLTGDGTLTYSWDGENRLKNTAGTSYTFDGDSLRLMKGTNDLYWYSAATCKHPLFGRSTSAGAYTDEFVHFNGQAVGYIDNTGGQTYHIVNDHLGSARVMTSATGVTKFDADYYPQGTPRVVTGTKDVVLKFQGKQLDTESGLTNAKRMYSPTLARFLPTRVAAVPPKPARKKPVPAPQSLNPGSLATSNPVTQPNSLISSFINLFAPGGIGSQSPAPCVFYFSVGDEMEHGVCGFEGPPDIDPIVLFATFGTWDCITRGKKLIKTRCVYACSPTGAKTEGIGIIDPPITHIKEACPNSKVDCPHFIRVDPGIVIFFKIRPDPPIVENSCVDFPT